MMLRKSAMFAAASVVALMTTPALSAGDRSAEGPGAGAQMQGGAQTQGDARIQGTARTQSETRIRADDLLDKDIRNAQGESIGDIDSVIIDENGEVAAVVVAVGGFLGMGEHNVAIDWNDLEIREDGGTIQSSMSREQLEALPAYDYERTEQRGTAFIDRSYRDPQAARQQTEDRTAAQTADQAGQAGQAEDWTEADRYRISNLIGASVVNENGEQIGEVEDVIVMDDQTHLVLGVGEFLGMGGRSVRLELDQAQLQHQQDNRDELRVSISMSKEELQALPEYNPDQWEAGQGSSN